MRRIKIIFLFHLGNAFLLLIGVIHFISQLLSGGITAETEEQKHALSLYYSTFFKMPSGQLRTLDSISVGYSYYCSTMFILIPLLLWASNYKNNNKPGKYQILLVIVALGILIGITYQYLILPPLIMLIGSLLCYFGYYLACRLKK